MSHSNEEVVYTVNLHGHHLIPTKEEIETNKLQDALAIPWDDDNFSLCLDTFPTSRFAKTKYNRFPTVSSPLRKHWHHSNLSEEEEEEEKVNGTVLYDVLLPGVNEERNEFFTLHNNSTTSTPGMSLNTRKKKNENPFPSSKHHPVKEVVIGGRFPYNNNGNFLPDNSVVVVAAATATATATAAKETEGLAPANKSHGNQKRKPSPIITRTQKTHQVEHLSPLSDSSIFLQNENDVFNKPQTPLSYSSSLLSLSSRGSLPSLIKSPLKPVTPNSLSSYSIKHGSSSASIVSNNSATTEAWKVTHPTRHHSPHASLNSLNKSLPSQPFRPQYPALKNTNHYLPQQPTTRPVYENSCYRSMSSSDIIGHDYFSPEYSNHSSYHTPNGSMSTSKTPSMLSSQSYHSVHISKNADNLVLYESSLQIDSNISDPVRPYSHLFKPSTHRQNSKQYNQHYRKKKQASLFTRLMKNIKHHFIKTES